MIIPAAGAEASHTRCDRPLPRTAPGRVAAASRFWQAGTHVEPLRDRARRRTGDGAAPRAPEPGALPLVGTVVGTVEGLTGLNTGAITNTVAGL